MAKGKSRYATWYCSDCGRGNYVTAYNPKNPNMVKELNKFCSQDRKTITHKRKDTKKGS